MLLRLLLLRWLSPTLFKFRLGCLLVMVLFFLAFVGECMYLMFHSLGQPSHYPPIHSTAPPSPVRR